MKRDVNSPPAGLLLVGHGTRDQQGIAEFRLVVEQIAQRVPEMVVEAAFLELVEPSIAAAMDRVVERGVRQLTVSPLLLFAAGHAQRDIPDAIAIATQRHPGLELRQAPHLGCHPRLLELSALRFAEAISNRSRGIGFQPVDRRVSALTGWKPIPLVPLAETMLLMVGRGSHNGDATAEMHQYTQRCAEQTGVAHAEACFMAMATPLLAEALPRVAAMPFGRIIVQTHFLFQGELLKRLGEQVQLAASRFPQQEWILAHHLGPHPLLCQALLDRAGCGCQLPL